MPRPRKRVPKRHERAHGQGSVVAHGDRWRAFRAPAGGKRESRIFDHREDAERWAAGGALSTRPTLGAWLDHWLGGTWPRLRPATKPLYRRYVAACAPLADYPLDLLTEDDWQALTNSLLSERWARSTVKVWLTAIRGAIRAAIPRYLPYSPLTTVKLPRANEQIPRAWSAEEVARLLAAARGELHEVWLIVSLGTGVRIGECVALERGDFDLRNLTVTISKQVVVSTRELGPTKTGRIRTVDVPEEIVPTLVAYLARLPAGQQRLFDRRADAYREWLLRICRKAQVTPLPPHSTRHTYASLALAGNTPIPDVAKALGHATPVTTLAIYSHFIGANERKAAKAVGAILGGVFGTENGDLHTDLFTNEAATR